ncbi:MAG: peptide chain release factor N(5)-glutamine methyltransferase [Anaerolineae bacterium]|nr:peptide chain release factor N(5)-glutamine methyltransferase [Anaerolineae bacterium]
MTDPDPHLAETQNRTIQTLLTHARQQLADAGCDSPRLDAELLLAHILGRERTWLYRYPQAEVSKANLAAFLKLIDRRVQREPVAYLIGHKAFYGLDFVVTPDTLIPRPETELLVETAIAWAGASIRAQAEASTHSQKPQYSIVDVGTGSGCIAVTLAKMVSEAHVTAVDLSDRALAVAHLNAERHEVADRMTFLIGDLLASLRAPVDLIASNPPYVDPDELTSPFTAPEVHRYEPRLALDGGEAGLAVVQRLLAQSPLFLKPGGMLLVEIGATQGNVVKKWAQAEFPTALVEIKPDLAGWDRLLVVKNRVD